MTFQRHALNGQFLQKVSAEEQAERLYKVNLTSNNISHIESSIKRFNKLRCIILDFNYISEIAHLNALFDLRELHLEGNFVSKIQGLQTCKNLTLLNLAANRIQKIQKISHLGKLQHLNLSQNRLERISNLQTLKELKVLNLSKNKIASLQSLPAFSKLESLLLNHNQIQKISATMFLNSLKLHRLDLSHNLLKETAFLAKLTSLEYLNISHNQIAQLSVQVPLNVLQELNISSNQLEQLPAIGKFFPELVILNINNNMFCSQHNLISSLSDNQMLTELYFSENPIHTQQFESTLQHLYQFDIINEISYNQPGTKYMASIRDIQDAMKANHLYSNLEDDEDDRKIKMSGFYNEELQNRMSGIKPHRPVSPAIKKARAIINDNGNDLKRNYQEFQANHQKLNNLRQVYQKICAEHNIAKPQIPSLQQLQDNGKQQNQVYLTEQKDRANLSKNEILSLEDQSRLNELRLRNDNNGKVMKEVKKQKEQKWAELKAKTKEKSFNIRRSRTKQLNSGSLSKTSSNTQQKRDKVSSDLMKTQLNPAVRRPFEAATGVKTFYRPSSQRKISKKQ